MSTIQNLALVARYTLLESLLDQDQTYKFLCVDLLPSNMYMQGYNTEKKQSQNNVDPLTLQVTCTLLVCCSFCKEST